MSDLAPARKLIEEYVPTTTHDRGLFVRAEHAFGAAVSFKEAR